MSASPNSGGKRAKPQRKKTRKRIRPRNLLVLFLVTCALGVFCALAGYMFILLNGENLYQQNKEKMEMAEASKVYDVNGNEVATLARENREIVSIQDIPDRLEQAFIATEDRRFNEHSGIDFWSIGRALVTDIVHRSMVEGGSTITQQLAKNMFLNADKTLFRKATEASIALALERHMTKEQILEAYLNRIYFGNGAYGVKAAAKKYFGKDDLNKLELWEMATLAAIPKAPSYYNPIAHPDSSKERRAVVLQLMKDQGYITEEERAQAAAVEYTYEPPAKTNDYVTFIDYVLNEAVEVSGKSEDELYRGGYRIYTTMDPVAQKAMEDAFKKDSLFQKDGPKQKMQGAMVIIDHRSGAIVGMVGGRGYKSKDMNRAVRPRAPGSSFKPIAVYAPAMELDFDKWNPNSMLKDEKMSFNGYTPSNWDNVYLGQISMMQALQKSANVASVWLLNEIGVNRGIEFAKKLNIELDPQKDRNLAIALGGLTNGVTPLQMAAAYGAFANNGQLLPSHSVLQIKDSNDKVVYEYKAPAPKQVMSPRTAWYMTVMLKNAVDNGTGASAKLANFPVAGKTGTTQLDIKGLEKYNRDVWFAGYTPEWTAAVWMGFDTTDKDHYVSGGSALPAVMFKEVMTKALAGHKATTFKKPNNVPELTRPPEAVTDLAAVYRPEDRSVILNWTPVQGNHIVYKVFRKGGKEPDFIELPRTTSPGLKDLGVLPGDRYEYYVVPYDSETNKEAPQSNVAAVEVPAEQGLDDHPGNGGNGNGPGGIGNGNGGKGNGPGGADNGHGGKGNGPGGAGNGHGGNGNGPGGVGTGSGGTGTGPGGIGTGGGGTGTSPGDVGTGSGGTGTGPGGTGTGGGGTGTGPGGTGTGSGGTGTGPGGIGTGSGGSGASPGGTGTGGGGTGTATGGTGTGGGGTGTGTGGTGTGGGGTGTGTRNFPINGLPE